MEKQKHTPGPWVTDCHGYIKSAETTVAQVFGPPFSCREPNSKLIAAAPDLLEVLIELQECAEYWSEYDVPLGIVDRINAAIKKATGENRGKNSSK
jgi:hypothetical protein